MGQVIGNISPSSITLKDVPGLNQGVRASSQNPYSGIFGQGNVRFFSVSGVFVVPDGCTRVRARLWGAGAPLVQPNVNNPQFGYYAQAVGGGSSFGNYVSATGGSNQLAPNSAPGHVGEFIVIGVGGVGIGGDINYNGGGSYLVPGGGGSGSLLGPGNIISGQGEKSGLTGTIGGDSASGSTSLSIDYIGTGSGGSHATLTSPATAGWNGGGGGGGGSTLAPRGAQGGFPGGGAGYNGSGWSGGGGGGFAMKDITGLVPGQSITVTVGAPNGLVIVEW